MKPTTTSTLFLGNFVRVSKDLYAPALGGIMLSIGIKLSIDDFGLALKRPVPLSIGYFAQYAIKPALGIVLAKIGNPLFKLDRGALATYKFFWSHGMIFDEVGLRIKNDCEFDRLVDASLIPIRERAKLKGELVPELGSACHPHSGTLGTIAYACVQIFAAGTFLGCFLTGLSFLLKDHSLLLGLVPIMAVSGVLIFISGFSIGMGAVPWLIMSEILPLNIKGVAGSLVVLVNWIGAWLVSYTFNFLVSWSFEDGSS